MRNSRCLLILFACTALALPLAAKDKEKIELHTFQYAGQARTWYGFIPAADPSAPLPVVVLLHGSNQNGSEMTGPWRDFAAREHIVLVAPNSLKPAVWDYDNDPPAFLHAAVAEAAALHPVDPHRIYLFGQSGGAVYALALAILDGGYFAAVGAHAATLPPVANDFFPHAPRPTPVALWVGDSDPGVSVAGVENTRDIFKAHGFPVQLIVIPNHGHVYDEESAWAINRAAWSFFSAHPLPADSAH
ncbi:MAG TPA: PHB depolymerase family esterase [Acidobacteriaceae bacterium]|jgi:polyhydroxybutyrate depolymerase|nr:PHB depolymerase family esterase [Acidobacteriaceae bacterium]